MEEYLGVMRNILCLILVLTTMRFAMLLLPEMVEYAKNTTEQNEETVSYEMPDAERYKKYENDDPADSYSGQLLYDDTGKTIIGLSFLKTASVEEQEEEPLTTPVEEQKEESLITNRIRIILGFLVAFALVVGVFLLLAPFLETYDSSMKEQTMKEQTMEEQVEDYRQYKQEQKNKQKQEKMEQLSDRIMACLASRFGTESLTYTKYESAVKSAMEQYRNNLESIKSYRQLMDSVSSEKQGKIQPLIDNLKAQNKDLYSRMEDLYISLETDRENDTDESIQRLQEVTEQLKYYKS